MMKVPATAGPQRVTNPQLLALLPLRAERFIFKPAAPQPIRAGLKGQGSKVRDADPSPRPSPPSATVSRLRGAGRGRLCGGLAGERAACFWTGSRCAIRPVIYRARLQGGRGEVIGCKLRIARVGQWIVVSPPTRGLPIPPVGLLRCSGASQFCLNPIKENIYLFIFLLLFTKKDAATSKTLALPLF